MGLDKVVDHEHGVTLVHGKRSDGVSGDMLLHQRNCYTGEATKSTRRKGTAQLKQRSTERRPWPSTRLDSLGGPP